MAAEAALPKVPVPPVQRTLAELEVEPLRVAFVLRQTVEPVPALTTGCGTTLIVTCDWALAHGAVPVAVRVWLYGTVAMPCGNGEAVVIVTGPQVICSVYACVPIQPRLSVALTVKLDVPVTVGVGLVPLAQYEALL